MVLSSYLLILGAILANSRAEPRLAQLASLASHSLSRMHQATTMYGVRKNKIHISYEHRVYGVDEEYQQTVLTH